MDLLLEHEIKATGTGRSPVKASEMKTCRKKYGDLFSMAVTGDLAIPDAFDTLAQDIGVVIYAATVGLVLSG